MFSISCMGAFVKSVIRKPAVAAKKAAARLTEPGGKAIMNAEDAFFGKKRRFRPVSGFLAVGQGP